MVLHIDTKDQKIIQVSLRQYGKILKSLSKQNEYGSQVLLPLIMKLLQPKTYNSSSSSSLSDLGVEDLSLRAEGLKTLKGIEVETGPGSFTGLRVGVSVANALAFALDIPVNGKKIETELNY